MKKSLIYLDLAYQGESLFKINWNLKLGLC